jgi:SGNH domain (fused to AT3 domains)
VFCDRLEKIGFESTITNNYLKACMLLIFSYRCNVGVAPCPADSCLYKADHRSLYFDDSHLSVYGALHVARTFEPCFAIDRR